MKKWPLIMGAAAFLAAAAGGYAWWRIALSQPVSLTVGSSSGSVTLGGRPLAAGEAPPAAGAEIATGADGFVALQLGDGSRLQLQPGTKLRITEAAANRGKDRYRVRMQLDAGEIERELPAPTADVKRDSEVLTRAINVGVRGTVFLVRAQGEAASVMVHRGGVALEGQGKPVNLAENYGTVARQGEPPEPPSVLPPPPALASPPQNARIAERTFAIAWEPVKEAKSYVWEVARDSAFTALVARGNTELTEATVTGLSDDGRHHWRVASLDQRGLQGRAGDSRGIHFKHHHDAGIAKVKAGDAAGALASFAAALKGYPDDPQLMKHIGWAHYVSGNLPAAKQNLDKSLATDATDLEARIMRGRVSFWLNDYVAAEQDYRYVLGVTPGEYDALWGLAETQLANGQARDALRTLEPVLAGNPRHKYAWMTAAKAWLAVGDREKSQRAALRELELNPDNAAARDLAGGAAKAK